MSSMEYAVLMIVAIVAVVLLVRLKSKEKYLETSYYYGAAPGARGERMVCSPEDEGVNGLGVAVNQIVGGCPAAVPAMCQQYVNQPKAKIINYPGAQFTPVTELGDMPPALYAAVVDPSRPPLVTRPGVTLGKTGIAYRRIGDEVLPFIKQNGKWVQVRKNLDGTWEKAPRQKPKPKVAYRRIGDEVLPFIKKNGKWVPVKKNSDGKWIVKPKPKPKPKPSKGGKPKIITIGSKKYMKKNGVWRQVKKDSKGKWKIVSGAVSPMIKINKGRVLVYKNGKWIVNKQNK